MFLSANHEQHVSQHTTRLTEIVACACIYSQGGMGVGSKDESALSEKELAALEKTYSKQCDELTATRAKIQQLDAAIAQVNLCMCLLLAAFGATGVC